MLMLDGKESLISRVLGRQMMALLRGKFGPDLDGLDLWAEMHPSQVAEWENCGISIQLVDSFRFDERGCPWRTFMGLPLVSNVHLSPQVVLIRKGREIVAGIGRLALTKWSTEEANAQTQR